MGDRIRKSSRNVDTKFRRPIRTSHAIEREQKFRYFSISYHYLNVNKVSGQSPLEKFYFDINTRKKNKKKNHNNFSFFKSNPFVSACNKTYYGDVGKTYGLELHRPKEDKVPYICKLTFTAPGGDLGDIIQVIN